MTGVYIYQSCVCWIGILTPIISEFDKWPGTSFTADRYTFFLARALLHPTEITTVFGSRPNPSAVNSSPRPLGTVIEYRPQKIHTMGQICCASGPLSGLLLMCRSNLIRLMVICKWLEYEQPYQLGRRCPQSANNCSTNLIPLKSSILLLFGLWSKTSNTQGRLRENNEIKLKKIRDLMGKLSIKMPSLKNMIGSQVRGLKIQVFKKMLS